MQFKAAFSQTRLSFASALHFANNKKHERLCWNVSYPRRILSELSSHRLLHYFICCIAIQRIRADVAVKATPKSPRDEISFERAGFDAPFHSEVACISGVGERGVGEGRGIERGFFSSCVGAHMCAYVWAWGKREKKLRGTRWLGEFRSVLCQLRNTVLGAAHVTGAIRWYYYDFLYGCAQSRKLAVCSTEKKKILVRTIEIFASLYSVCFKISMKDQKVEKTHNTRLICYQII